MSTLISIRNHARTGNVTKLMMMRDRMFAITPEEFISATFDGICQGSPDNVEQLIRAIQSIPMYNVEPNKLVSFVSRVCATGHVGAARTVLSYAFEVMPIVTHDCANCMYWEQIIANVMVNRPACDTLASTRIPVYIIEMLANAGSVDCIDWERVYMRIRDQCSQRPAHAPTRLPSIVRAPGAMSRTHALDDLHSTYMADANSHCSLLDALVDACHAWHAC
ncbi:MAG: hypothetical protein WC919_04680 [Candidatus Paceibacterota bacterium]|jgi:hypothetical protein